MSIHNPYKINKSFIPLFESEDRYLIVFGGAGSGKSYFAAQKILWRIMEEDNHRILICRKVAKTLKQSIFRLIIQLIMEYNLKEEFEINKTEKSIIHIPTGNEIICNGLDDPEKLKSIFDITSIWVEECTELEENDFDQLDLRLRGMTTNYKQIIVTFNPIDENHWIKKRFVDHPPEDTLVHHSTFLDNEFIDPEYEKVLKSKSETNPNYYRIYYRGEWGVPEVKRPFMYNFDSAKHIKSGIKLNYNYPLRISFDFNIDPFVCVIGQIFQDIEGHHIHFLNEIELKNGDVFTMCEKLISLYGKELISTALFTGDAMQQKREITQRDNSTAWELISRQLKISPNRLHLTKTNPLISNSGMLCNTILANHPDISFDVNCRQTINDMRMVECSPEGQIIKSNRKQNNQRSDFLDAVRYFLHTWMADYKV